MTSIKFSMHRPYISNRKGIRIRDRLEGRETLCLVAKVMDADICKIQM